MVYCTYVGRLATGVRRSTRECRCHCLDCKIGRVQCQRSRLFCSSSKAYGKNWFSPRSSQRARLRAFRECWSPADVLVSGGSRRDPGDKNPRVSASSDDRCDFCSELGKPEGRPNALSALLGGASQTEYLLHYTGTLGVIPSIGALAPGHVLVCPVRHVGSERGIGRGRV